MVADNGLRFFANSPEVVAMHWRPNGEWAKEKEKVYQDKALEMFKLAYERQEKRLY